jgi:uncharacterized protein (TIGR01777 family)
MGNILISGGTGLIGTCLSGLLRSEGHDVAYLTRQKVNNLHGFKAFAWDIDQFYIDPLAIEWADHIIHLAGEPVAGGRWTKKRKKDILDSRILSTRLLFENLQQLDHKVSSLIGASAVGAYGSDVNPTLVDEESDFGPDFLAEVVRQWENRTQKVQTLGIRTVIVRVGIVLSTKGGALKKMAAPVKYGIGAPLGSGNQIMSWIHIHDLAGIFIKAINDTTMTGIYNAVAPHPVSNSAFTNALAKELKRPLLLPNIPEFMMRILLGEMSEMIVGGRAVSAAKIIASGYNFLYPRLDKALQDLYDG